MPILARQVVVELDAELVPGVGLDLVTRRVGEVVAHARKIRPHRRERDHVARYLAEARERNLVVGKRIPHEARSVRIHACRRRIVDGDQVAVGVAPVREVAVVHLRGRNGRHHGRRGALVAVRLVGTEEERLVPAVVQPGNQDRAAEHATEIMLLERRFRTAGRLVEVVVRVELFVAVELERLPPPVVRARSRHEAHRPAARVAELRLEPVGIDRELVDRLDRRRVEGRPQPLLERGAWRRRHAVDREIPAALLAAANDDVAAVAVPADPGFASGAIRLRSSGDRSAPPTTSGRSWMNLLLIAVVTLTLSV